MGISQYLANALLADYYFINQQIDRFSGVNFLVPLSMANQYGQLFSALDIDFCGYDYTIEPTKFMWLEFASESERDKADDYFSGFNASSREVGMILKPDIYEGNSSPNQNLCELYLNSIEKFFENDFQGLIGIPVGLGEFGIEEREYMVYSNNEVKGLFKESMLSKA